MPCDAREKRILKVSVCCQTLECIFGIGMRISVSSYGYNLQGILLCMGFLGVKLPCEVSHCMHHHLSFGYYDLKVVSDPQPCTIDRL